MGCFAFNPASRKPVKRYKPLVQDVFDKKLAPRFHEAFDSSMEKKFKKVKDYLELNPQRVPKVSRRLDRTIASSIRNAKNHGMVRVGVHAYIYLLAALPPENNSLFAKEVVVKETSVVYTLLSYKGVELNVLGVELLAAFIHSQAEAKSSDYLEQVEAFVPQVCKMCSSALELQRKAPTAGEKQAAMQLSCSCLRALGELVHLTTVVSAIPHHIPCILNASLNVVKAVPAKEQKAVSPEDVLLDHPILDHKMLSHVVPDLLPFGCLRTSAEQTMQELGSLLEGPVLGHEVATSLMAFLDRGKHWVDGSPLASEAFSLLRPPGTERVVQRSALLYKELLVHVAAPGLDTAMRKNVLLCAEQEALLLVGGFAEHAVLLALKQLPEAEAQLADAALVPALESHVRAVSLHLGSGAALVEVLGSVLDRSLPLPPELAEPLLRYVLKSAEVMQEYLPQHATAEGFGELRGLAMLSADGPTQARKLPGGALPRVVVHSVAQNLLSRPVQLRSAAAAIACCMLPLSPAGLSPALARTLHHGTFSAMLQTNNAPADIHALQALLHTVLRTASSPIVVVETVHMLGRLVDDLLQPPVEAEAAEQPEPSPSTNGSPAEELGPTLPPVPTCGILEAVNALLPALHQLLPAPALRDSCLLAAGRANGALRCVSCALEVVQDTWPQDSGSVTAARDALQKERERFGKPTWAGAVMEGISGTAGFKAAAKTLGEVAAQKVLRQPWQPEEGTGLNQLKGALSRQPQEPPGAQTVEIMQQLAESSSRMLGDAPGPAPHEASDKVMTLQEALQSGQLQSAAAESGDLGAQAVQLASSLAGGVVPRSDMDTARGDASSPALAAALQLAEEASNKILADPHVGQLAVAPDPVLG